MPAAVWIPAAIGAIGTAASISASNKQAKNAASQQKNLAQPGVNAQKYALPEMQNFIEGTLKPGLGLKSAAMETAHKSNLADINLADQSARKSINAFWTNNGNLGRGRGELLRSEFNTSAARRSENTAFGLNTENYLDAKKGQYLNSLATLGGQGSQSLGLAAGAIQGQNTAKQDMYGDLASMAGSLAAWGLSKYAPKTPKPKPTTASTVDSSTWGLSKN